MQVENKQRLILIILTAIFIAALIYTIFDKEMDLPTRIGAIIFELGLIVLNLHTYLKIK